MGQSRGLPGARIGSQFVPEMLAATAADGGKRPCRWDGLGVEKFPDIALWRDPADGAKVLALGTEAEGERAASAGFAMRLRANVADPINLYPVTADNRTFASPHHGHGQRDRFALWSKSSPPRPLGLCGRKVDLQRPVP